MTKLLTCATDGCETEFERRSPRHKYCDACATKRKHDYNKVWYETVGAEWKKGNYQENKKKLAGKIDTRTTEEKRRERHKKYQRRPEVKERRKKYHQRPEVKEQDVRSRAELVQLKRERLIREDERGGSPLIKRDAPISYPYLTGVAKYNSTRRK